MLWNHSNKIVKSCTKYTLVVVFYVTYLGSALGQTLGNEYGKTLPLLRNISLKSNIIKLTYLPTSHNARLLEYWKSETSM